MLYEVPDEMPNWWKRVDWRRIGMAIGGSREWAAIPFPCPDCEEES